MDRPRQTPVSGRPGVSVAVWVLMVTAACAPHPATVGPRDGESAERRQGAPPFLESVRPRVEPTVRQYVGEQEASTRRALQNDSQGAADFRRSEVVQALRSPWDGLIRLERHAHRIAQHAAQEPLDVASLLDALPHPLIRQGSAWRLPEPPGDATLDVHVDYVEMVLGQAQALRAIALQALTTEERRFLYEYAEALVERFSPQLLHSAETLAEQDRLARFSRLVTDRLAYEMLGGSATLLARLADPRWLARLARAAAGVEMGAQSVQGVTGHVLMARDTPMGRILVGGPGANHYELTGDVAAVIDIAGADTYRGVIAASSVQVGNSLVIDLSGDDRYEATALGLATGRLGVGMLVDGAGHDLYQLSPGAGGTGFAGIGLLIDLAGHDRYAGTKLTQGAAIGGVGVLLDVDGRDAYTGDGYGMGFGGPLGTGVIVDVAGDDSFRCGDAYPSAYNAADAPDGKPGDPLFQYDAFCIGVGSGMRVLGEDDRLRGVQLAGGVGFALDLAGNDQYHSANFSQGTGYFFGAGVKLDAGGNDLHEAARYGHGTAAHRGVGLFVDGEGEDHYASTGPVFNAGTAWDLSVALFLEAGSGDDRYDLARSDGLGRAQLGSWSLFIDEAGNDRYTATRGMGLASDNSISAFFDLDGVDAYLLSVTGPQGERGNGRTLSDGAGLFVDR